MLQNEIKNNYYKSVVISIDLKKITCNHKEITRLSEDNLIFTLC